MTDLTAFLRKGGFFVPDAQDRRRVSGAYMAAAFRAHDEVKND